MSVGDGTLTVVAKNQGVMDKVQEKVSLPFCWYCVHQVGLWLQQLNIHSIEVPKKPPKVSMIHTGPKRKGGWGWVGG